ncbi:D-amino-acid oxidase [Cypionkella aquatica]|uniref:D-amino-acid oxidase n=1 Tax=Cypionkella aquatica TaxID=1756042 RepID=A0AA37U0A3_9RHOB|nr:FAD-binding oxidoreductase [Cypionkella aquatica]GLS87403.1 D-amino-acid oxidase [Cypionkella aquatica]GLS88590.1 D-amino-acid oxidase [Cypionkella aquatica]
MAQSVLIIGAGIIGASLAFHLARHGAQVTVLDAATPASAASGRSFGWINASFYENPAHHHLRVAAMAAHHRLAHLLPDAAPNWQGTLWFEQQGADFETKAAELAALGYAAKAVTQAEIATLEPRVANPPAQALHIAAEGSVDPAALTRALLAASGAKVLSGIAAKSLIEAAGQIKGARTAIGPFTADHTVLAAGVASPALLAPLGLDLPMLTRPGIMVYTKPVTWRINHILVTPDQEIRQDASGAILAPGIVNHQADASESIANPQAMADATLHRLRARFNAPDLELDRFTLGFRPVPADGLPLIGAVLPGLSLAVMHSGVTLSALAGEALAAEITGQGDHPLLGDFRPNRLLRTI